jgi:3-oxoadipate enol-lactonase
VVTEIELAGARFNYRVDAAAHLPASAPVLVLSNSLGTNLAMWEPQVAAFTQHFRVLRYDSRGHGTTAVTPGPYEIAQLAQDVIGLLDALAIPRAHYCGLSLGAMVGMWLGANAPGRIDRLVLCNTTARVASPEAYDARIGKVRADGIASIADAVLERWFTPAFRLRAPEVLARMREMLIATPVEGYAGACAAIRDMDQWGALPRIRRPTLVIAGALDMATTAADGRRMAQAIPGAEYVELDAAHLSNIEAEAAFTAAVSGFLGK